MRIIPKAKIMKKLAITRRLIIAIRSKQGQGRRTGASEAAESGRRAGWRFNQYGSSCCRFAAGAAIGNIIFY